jgi:outer membrane lipoprotein SlyB
MSTRHVVKLALAACLLAAAASPALAQSNQPQKIRYGTITALDRAVVEVETSGSGGQVGATVGAVAGYALADGRDRWLGALAGGVLGGAAGRAAERGARKRKGWQLIIRLEETGEEIGVPIPGKKKPFEVGDRVRLLTSPGGKTQVTRAPR